MASIIDVAQIYDNSGNAVAASYVNANAYKFKSSQSDVGREVIISVTRTNENGGLTDAVLQSVYSWVTRAHGSAGVSTTGDAFTVAAIGTADGAAFVNTAAAIAGDTAQETIYMRLQGTGSIVAAEADAGVSNLTVAVVGYFAPLL